MGKATPTATQRRLVAVWRGSTLSKAAFAKAHGVHPGTFASWVARHEEDAAVPSMACTFVRVTTTPAVAPSATFVVQVDALALRFGAPPPPAWFAAVLRELAPC